MNRSRTFLVLVTIGAAGVAAGGLYQGASARPRLVREVPWAAEGVWLRADTHMHTRFSDGSYPLEEVVKQGASSGCDVVAPTDHSDQDLRVATPEYFAALTAAREAHPSLVVLAGLEWNVPPRGGDEHVVLLVPPALEQNLAEFKARFDDYQRDTHEAAMAVDALRGLAGLAPKGEARPVLVYEHPSRRDARSMDNADDMRAWRSVNDIVIGVAGAPGHQGMRVVGAYEHTLRTIDRWDPVAAQIGDAWDTVLGEGLDVWGAYAPSDHHNEREDYWPCQFAETWVHAPERSAEGVLRALRAGSFWAAHGHIVRTVAFEVAVEGLPRPAVPGEVVQAAAGTVARVSLSFEVPAQDWKGDPNRVDEVELIQVDRAGARSVQVGPPAKEGPALTTNITVPDGGMVLRARGRRVEPDGPDLMFYTNPIRIITAR